MYRHLLIGPLFFLMLGGASRSLLAQTNGGEQSTPAGAEDKPRITDQDIELLRKDLRAQKKQIVAANLKLTNRSGN
jgi:hypothetical protein